MMRSRTLFAAVIMAATGHMAAARASILYVTNGDSSRLVLVNTTKGTISTSKKSQYGQYPIAVTSTVWLGSYHGSLASEYTLGGVATGSTASAPGDWAVDGTTDGTVNYELSNIYNNGATVYQANKDWTNPVVLFDIAGGSGLSSSGLNGIAYAAASRTLWIAGTTAIYQYDLAGNLLSQFGKPAFSGGLAYDQPSNTLWFVYNGLETISQYSTSGTLLQSKEIPGLAYNNWGVEIALEAAPVPEPGTLAILGAALAGLGLLRKHRAA
jgi:hypothetical protein